LSHHGLDLGPIARVELACRDLSRQRDFYVRVLGLPAERGNEARFRIGQLELVLRPRCDALFPRRSDEARPPPEVGALLAFPVPPDELDRWYRRMLSARVAVLDAPGPAGAPPRLLRVPDPEGNVIELFARP
jgi:catechol 2,3-dioxygenase-like lactoylglutathione lyase family enzyme